MMRRLTMIALLLLAFGLQKVAAQGTCTLSVTPLNFGSTYTGATLDGTATATVNCSGAGGWEILMYTGAGAGATETIRYMTGPGGVELSYRLFTDSARTNNWANVAPYWVTGNGNATVTVWGQIPSGQAVPSGTYTDTMTTATTQFTVSVVITNTCSISASNLNFGTYQGAVIDATSAITVNCTALAPFNIGLNAGNGNGATVTLRKMTGPRAATLNYTLYRDSAHSLIWGNTVGTNTLSASGTGSAVQYPVYGRIPAGTVPAAGSYTDTITVTLTY